MPLDKFLKKSAFGSFINGAFRIDTHSKSSHLKSPVIGKKWKTLFPARRGDVQDAIVSAQNSFRSWKKIPPPRRADLLRAFSEIMLENKHLLAEVMTLEMGKCIQDGYAEVEYAASYFKWFAGEAERIFGITLPSNSAEKVLSIFQEPIGVCAFITPWNFPLAMGARKIAAALAAGCTAIIKPSEECPISMLSLAYLFKSLKLPDGVFNVLVGPSKEIGNELLRSPIVKKISFTGSVEVGKYLYRSSADTLKKLTLELGGHAPVLVLNDAHLDVAVRETIRAKFRNNGQTCVSPNRLLVQRGIYRPFLDEFVHQVKKLRVGDPFDVKTDMSKILHPASLKKVKEHIKDALDKGAKVELLTNDPYMPAILSGITPAMKIFKEETFGPVIGVTEFNHEMEGLCLANSSPYGLAAYLFTENLKLSHLCVDALEYGIIGLNDGAISCAQASFGGVKSSGFGREGGPNGIREYLVDKYVSVGIV